MSLPTMNELPLSIWPSPTNSSLNETSTSPLPKVSRSASSMRTMYSVQHPGSHSRKRSSIFHLRSKSNTATSMATPLPSISLHKSRSEVSLAESYARSEQCESGTAMSLFRGRKVKRTSDAPPFDQHVEAAEQPVSIKRTLVMHRSQGQSSSEGHTMRYRISNPFDFKHLYHTGRDQAIALDRVHFNDASHDVATTSEASMSPRSTHAPSETRDVHQASVHGTTSPLGLSKSADQLAQMPTSNRASLIPQFPLLSPPMSLDSEPGASEDLGHRYRAKQSSGAWLQLNLYDVVTPEPSPGMTEISSYFAHALTTPDDSAIHAATVPFSPSLEDVAEDETAEDVAEQPERFTSPRPAPHPPRAFVSPRSSAFRSFSFSSQRSPSRSAPCEMTYASPKSSAPRSPVTHSMVETMNARLSRRSSVYRSKSIHRTSNTWRGINDSWEDDIDYIYDNELEADCDFEWDCESGGAPTMETRLSILCSRVNSMSQDIPDSPQSSLIKFGEPTEPAVATNRKCLSACQSTVLESVHVLPQDFKDTYEVSYENLLQEYAGSEHDVTVLDPEQSVTSSGRSSCLESSRRSSCDSSVNFSVPHAGEYSSAISRCASIADSLPDLVPSQRTAVDHPSELQDRLQLARNESLPSDLR